MALSSPPLLPVLRQLAKSCWPVKRRHEMPRTRPRFSIRAALIVIALLAVSFALIRGAFLVWISTDIVNEFIVRTLLLLTGVHLLAGTIGSSIGGFFRGRRGAVVGAVAAIYIMRVLAFFLLPTVG
jgi:hypothetical protein